MRYACLLAGGITILSACNAPQGVETGSKAQIAAVREPVSPVRLMKLFLETCASDPYGFRNVRNLFAAHGLAVRTVSGGYAHPAEDINAYLTGINDESVLCSISAETKWSEDANKAVFAGYGILAAEIGDFEEIFKNSHGDFVAFGDRYAALIQFKWNPATGRSEVSYLSDWGRTRNRNRPTQPSVPRVSI